MPKATAYDLLGEISRKVPANEDIKLDIIELDIRPKKVIIRGTVDSAAAVDELQAKLEEHRVLRGDHQGRRSPRCRAGPRASP